ncbi:hypothetical protein [Streptomyces sp. NPDC004658]|uniref:hypothetical protein n=1 Tax=Streptomyces sp. NPDC004658 TaxID=3154672 RepID=UPI0033AB3A72
MSESPGHRDAHGCDHKVCVNVVGNASGNTTSGYYSGSNRFYGHINVWGPGMRVEGRDSAYSGVAGKGRGSGQTCAEGWELDNGRYTSPWACPARTSADRPGSSRPGPRRRAAPAAHRPGVVRGPGSRGAAVRPGVRDAESPPGGGRREPRDPGVPSRTPQGVHLITSPG